MIVSRSQVNATHKPAGEGKGLNFKGKKGEESKFLRTTSEPKIALLQIELIFQDFNNL